MNQEELRERLETLDIAEQSAGMGVWDVDLGTNTAQASPQFFRIMGLEPARGRFSLAPIEVLRHPQDRERVRASMRQALENASGTYEVEYRILRPDGEVRWILGRGRVVRDADGKPVRYSGIEIDITDRKRNDAQGAEEAEARLRLAQKTRVLRELAGSIAHDFNNLLQVITGNLELLKHRREPFLPTIDAGLQATRAAARLTHRLLSLTRVQPLQPAPLKVNDLIIGLSGTMTRALGEAIRLETELGADLWPAFADRDQLEIVLLNLILDAREAMPEGGQLALRTRNVTVPAALAEAPAGDYVLIELTDTRRGNLRQHAASACDLGAGGYMRIHNRVGKGTSVRLYAPRVGASS